MFSGPLRLSGLNKVWGEYLYSTANYTEYKQPHGFLPDKSFDFLLVNAIDDMIDMRVPRGRWFFTAKNSGLLYGFLAVADLFAEDEEGEGADNDNSNN
jgi:hypothetical protein